MYFTSLNNSQVRTSSVVRGGNVKVGDQVYVDCSYSEHLPFKWNAKCVQLLEQKQDMGPSPYMQHPGMSGRDPVDPRKAAGFYRDDPKTDSIYQQNRNPVFVSEYSQQSDVSQLAQNVAVQQNYQQQMPQAVSTYGNLERDFKSAGFANNDQITYTSTPGKFRLLSISVFLDYFCRICFCYHTTSASDCKCSCCCGRSIASC